MSYIALYRKYRPIIFEDIVGQENVTKVLQNQIKSGKISHAYIFSGSRGTGKTSAAKVFSRAINCLNPKDGEPCNECQVCKNILDGSMTDVIEMDAASNNSVENIRQIRQEVVYATIDVKYRVYIIDEVHMLTTSAFNALLKTLEEPPKNVVFILATTEQHKIPVTILSRCLKFEFGRVPTLKIIERLKYVLSQENLKYEDEALEYIANLADGALRDALSILDRCITESKDILKYDDVLEIVGAIDKVVIEELANNIYDLKVFETINIIDDLINKGKDLRQLVLQITEEFLNMLIKDNETKDKTKQKRIIEIIDKLSKLDNELKQTTKPEILLKAYIIEICNIKSISNVAQNTNQNNDGYFDSLNQKIINLEKQLNDLNEKIKNKSITDNTNYSIPTNQNKNNQKLSEEVIKSSCENIPEFEDVDNFKKEIVQKGKLKIFSALAGAKIYVLEQGILIITENKFAYNILRLDETLDVIRTVFKEKYNIEKTININLGNAKEEMGNKFENIFKENDIKYTSMD